MATCSRNTANRGRTGRLATSTAKRGLMIKTRTGTNSVRLRQAEQRSFAEPRRPGSIARMDFRFKYRKKPPSREELAEQVREEETRLVQGRGLALGYAIPSAL